VKALTIPAVGEAVPRRGSAFGRGLGRLVLRLGGWSVTGTIPSLSHAVIIVGPHTSNWDFVVGMAAMLALDLDLRFLGKHTIFRWPLGPIVRFLGGIPVDRTRPQSGRVEALATRFKTSDHLLLALSPEGTRKIVRRWHTGFHHIATAAGVPIIPAALDYGTHTIRFGRPYTPTPDLDHDLAELQAFFASVQGRRPQHPSTTSGHGD